MIDSHLCVGGPMDGQRNDCDSETFRVPLFRPLSQLLAMPLKPEEPTDVKVVEYRKQMFNTGDQVIALWAPATQTPFTTLTLLLEGYRAG